MTVHNPLERSVRRRQIFTSSTSLNALKFADVRDSRCKSYSQVFTCSTSSDHNHGVVFFIYPDLQNAFMLVDAEGEWLLSADDADSKFEFISALETAMSTAVEE